MSDDITARLVSLTAGEAVQNDTLDELKSRVESLERDIRGDKETIGIVAELRELHARMNMFDRLWAPDALGNGGIKNRLAGLEQWKEKSTTESEYKRKYQTTIIITIISTIGLLLTNLDRVADGFKRFAPNSPVFEKPKKVKKPIKKKKVVVPCNPEIDECPDTAASQS